MKKKKISTSISAMGSSFEQKFGPGGSGAFSDGIGGGGGMAGPSKGEVSAQDLAILQQRLGGQRITMEGASERNGWNKRVDRRSRKPDERGTKTD